MRIKLFLPSVILLASCSGAWCADGTPVAGATSENSRSVAESGVPAAQPGATPPASQEPPRMTPPSPSAAPIATPTTAGDPQEVAAGPYEADRKKVRQWLIDAKKRGVGIGNYLKVYDDMESSVKSGEKEEVVKSKLDNILSCINDQYRASRQRHRPIKPKTHPDENIEVIRVKWVGPKGSEGEFRNQADAWFNDAMDRLPPEQRGDSQLKNKIYAQRDQLFKEMVQRWKAGERQWGPRTYKNMNPELGSALERKGPSGQVPYGR